MQRPGRRRCCKAPSCGREFVAELYQHVPVLDPGARGATNDLRRSAGSATCCWPGRTRRSWRLQASSASEGFEIVVPRSASVGRARPSRWSTSVGRQKRLTRVAAQAYPRVSLLHPEARRSRRRTTTARAERVAQRSTPARSRRSHLFTLDDVFGGWSARRSRRTSDDGGVFDRLWANAVGRWRRRTCQPTRSEPASSSSAAAEPRPDRAARVWPGPSTSRPSGVQRLVARRARASPGRP